ncbi:AAA family ATPase [Denitrobaculum tricleocarpae]|uniref:AAA family ATPase n=1 Tax=Denitrobaculum tricleocarpae TaxID=2591009 RepID=A0A545SXN6_9PROT|nr:AAA family ATPase [Denitrobaculum tricleocarpae]TQV69721.1 AAA family ATPase [Denitrobaculum tricleocarpae]
MRIDFVEVCNFRKLQSVRLEFAEKQTLLVGANNSGKTSAMVALRYFLKERGGFSVKDVTASNWIAIEKQTEIWRQLPDDQEPDPEKLYAQLPQMDVWLSVKDNELHHVAHLIPSLDWEDGLLGVRIRLEAKTFDELVSEYFKERSKAEARLKTLKKDKNSPAGFSLWPKSFQDFLERQLSTKFELKGYLLDPKQLSANDSLKPQSLPDNAVAIRGNPFSGLLHIKEIRAQRGFSDASDGKASLDDDGEQISGRTSRKLSDQLAAYYKRHLDPDKDPTEEDVSALGAFHVAQRTFDERLKKGFADAIGELETLGYPGISNPKLSISTRIRPTDGLNHPSAVQYDIGGQGGPIRLPENYNGLGFQNLISMVFLLMRFRDDWMRVGKFSGDETAEPQGAIAPLQLILIEEPEAHLHAQVQQVFMRRAYDVLRNHPSLGKKPLFVTQLIVSTHSSHIAHEVEFADLRYFKRLPPKPPLVSTSKVANLRGLFGKDDETTRFARRYLQTTHCDLFFADGVILVEGAAERILLPHFISNQFSNLAERYLSLLEIGGSHAHRLKPLIELLCVPTLIITDLDAINPADNRKSVPPKKGQGYATSNSVLKTWIPKQAAVDVLLDENDVSVATGEGFGEVGVVYQRSQAVEFPVGAQAADIIPSTFEDALVLANHAAVGNLKGVAMTNAFATAVKESGDASALAQALYDRLETRPEKAAFALDLLSIKDLKLLHAPKYIADGLTWLESQMLKAQDQ